MPATPSAADLLAAAARRHALLDLLARTVSPTYGARRNAAAALQELTATARERRAAAQALQELTATAAERSAAAAASGADRTTHRARTGARDSRRARRAPAGRRS